VRIDLHALLRAKFGDKADKMSVDEIALRAAGSNPVRTEVQVRGFRVFSTQRSYRLDVCFYINSPFVVNLKVKIWSTEDGAVRWLANDGSWKEEESEVKGVELDDWTGEASLDLPLIPEGFDLLLVEGRDAEEGQEDAEACSAAVSIPVP
jgi:hypothetical protein